MAGDRSASAAPRVLVGVDLVSVQRVTSLLAQPDVAGEVFTARELRYAAGRRRRGEHLAARFAAKEAVFKALGTGLSGGVGWRDVEVVNAASGRPRLRLSGAAEAIAGCFDVRSMEISLSHLDGVALAFVVLLCGRDSAPTPAGQRAAATVGRQA